MWTLPSLISHFRYIACPCERPDHATLIQTRLHTGNIHLMASLSSDMRTEPPTRLQLVRHQHEHTLDHPSTLCAVHISVPHPLYSSPGCFWGLPCYFPDLPDGLHAHDTGLVGTMLALSFDLCLAVHRDGTPLTNQPFSVHRMPMRATRPCHTDTNPCAHPQYPSGGLTEQ